MHTPALHSYRVVVRHGDPDDAGCRELVGLKAPGPFQACCLAMSVTGAKGIDHVYRQDAAPARSAA